MSDTPSDVVVFRVIGERADDSGHLLLASPDGRWYDYDVARGTVAQAEPTARWKIDVHDGAEVHMWTPTSTIFA